MQNTKVQATEAALVTGASHGIGRCLAEEFAQRGIALVMVALPSPELEESADFLREKYALSVWTLAADLTQDASAQEIFDFCQKEGIGIRYLCNNAGMGYTGKIENFSLDFLERLMKLNMLATVRLTHLFLPQLRQHPQSYILNVASMAALYDMPYKVVYSASKSFVYSFSRALREELRGTGVSLTVLCPGGVATNAQVKATVEKLGKMAKYLTASPEEVAATAIKALLKEKAMYIPKRLTRVYAALRHVVPYGLQMRILGHFLGKKYRD